METLNNRFLSSLPDLDWQEEERKLKRALLPLKIWLGFFSFIALLSANAFLAIVFFGAAIFLLFYLHQSIKRQVLIIHNGRKYWATILSQKESALSKEVWIAEVCLSEGMRKTVTFTMSKNQAQIFLFKNKKLLSIYKNEKWPKVGDKIGVYYWDGDSAKAIPIREFEKTS